MIKVAIDLDDLCLEYADKLEVLDVLKKEYPAFKITLFGIPQKMNDYLLQEVQDRGYIRVGMHGWAHTDNMECNRWKNLKAIRDKLKYWKKKAKRFDCLDKSFKAPGWWISPETVQILNEHKWWVAVNPENPTFHLSQPDRPYVVHHGIDEVPAAIQQNAETPGDRPVFGLHGHLQNVCGNGIEESFLRVCQLPDDTEFYWVNEVMNET